MMGFSWLVRLAEAVPAFAQFARALGWFLVFCAAIGSKALGGLIVFRFFLRVFSVLTLFDFTQMGSFLAAAFFPTFFQKSWAPPRFGILKITAPFIIEPILSLEYLSRSSLLVPPLPNTR